MTQRGQKSPGELAGIAFRQRLMEADQAALGDDPGSPPAHLSQATQTWWRGIIRTIEPHQLRTLQAAAEAWDLYTQAREVVAKEGLSYSDERGRRFARPEINIAKDARAAYLRAMRDLKLDSPPPKQPPPYDHFGSLIDPTVVRRW